MVDAIKDLYAYALVEGEGVGTAYEYAAKARFAGSLVRKSGDRVPRVLIAGLPEKYGASLDFALLASRAGAELRIVDERAEAIVRAERSIDSMKRLGYLRALPVVFQRLGSLDEIGTLEPHDVALSCEVIQRVPVPARARFAAQIRAVAPRGAVFVPNSENSAHLKISGLAGLSLRELRDLFGGARLAYVDMPPFPPGISRTAAQRAQASTGRIEGLAMRALDAYCAGERFVPSVVKRHVAHIVCALWGA